MRVLHLPQNIASQVSVSVRSLREVGVESRGLVIGNASIQDPTGVECLDVLVSRRQHPLRGTLQLLNRWQVILQAIRWADVVHWHFCWALPNAFDVKFAAWLRKARVVQFWGSDIRKREICVCRQSVPCEHVQNASRA